MSEPGAADVHDGHGNYVAEAAQDLRWLSLRRFGEFVIAVLAGWTVAYWVYRATWPARPSASVAVAGGFGLGVVGLVASLMYAGFAGDLALPRRTRKWIAISCVVAFALTVAWSRSGVRD